MSNSDQHQFKDRYMLRLPDGMRDRIKTVADANNRSMNAEIVATLREKYPPKDVRLDMLEHFLEGYNAKLRLALSKNDQEAVERFRTVIETLEHDIAHYVDSSGSGDGAGYGDGSGDGSGSGDGAGDGDGSGHG